MRRYTATLAKIFKRKASNKLEHSFRRPVTYNNNKSNKLSKENQNKYNHDDHLFDLYGYDIMKLPQTNWKELR
jgi:hypothetical protein